MKKKIIKCKHECYDDGDAMQIVCKKCGLRHDVRFDNSDVMKIMDKTFSNLSEIWDKPMSKKEFERFMNDTMTDKEKAKIMKRKSGRGTKK